MLLLLVACLPAQTFQPEDVGRRAIVNGLEQDASHCPFGLASFCTPGPLLDAALDEAVAIHGTAEGRIPIDAREAFVRTVRERYRAQWDGLAGIGPVRERIAQVHANPPLRRDGWTCVIDIGPQPGRLVVDDGHLAVRDPSLPDALLDLAITKAEAADPPCGTLEVHSVVTHVDRGRLVVEPRVHPMKTTFVAADR